MIAWWNHSKWESIKDEINFYKSQIEKLEIL